MADESLGTAVAVDAVPVAGRTRAPKEIAPVPASIGFDWAMAVLSAVFVGGLFLDGWAHTHGRVDQSFFTPWHAVFYAGYGAVASALLASLLRTHAPGRPWRRAVPPGYGLSLLGALIFAVGGVGDLIWHTLFGIEAGVEALLSPTHLVLALGMGLVVSGPVRARRQRPEPASSWTAAGPMLLALTSTLSVLTFFTEYAHPLVFAAAGAGHPYGGSEGLGVASILLQTGILMGMVLPAVRGAALPAGALALMVTLNAGAMGLLNFSGGYPVALVVAAGAGGLLADVMRGVLRPSAGRPAAWRIFAFVVPALFYFCYFIALILTEGIAWSVHLWAGSIVLAGLAGCLLSCLLVPPQSS
jgi:hypothetical protein